MFAKPYYKLLSLNNAPRWAYKKAASGEHVFAKPYYKLLSLNNARAGLMKTVIWRTCVRQTSLKTDVFECDLGAGLIKSVIWRTCVAKTY